MRYSRLKHELEVMELNHKHEVVLMKMKHEQEKKKLLASCTHAYEDGTSAKVMAGVQWDMYYKCNICSKTF